LFTQSSVRDATATSFPLSKHTGGGDTAPAFSGLRVYLQLTWEVGLLPSPVEFSSQHHYYKLSCSCLLGMCCCSCWPACLFTAHVGGGSSPSLVEFSSLHHSHKLSRFCLLGAHPCSHPLWPGLACLFTVPGGMPLPHSSVLRAPHPLCYMSLLFLLLITQFLFCPQVGVSLSRGLCCSGPGFLWEYHIPLSSPCPRLPKLSGHGHLVAWGPSWFLHLM
jgi:hypothetical protein